MSCNPSIGGIGKGHLVREVDALGGIMGLAADEAGIQFRVLNASKGPAVHGPRAQMDRELYRAAVKKLLCNIPELTIREASVEDLLINTEFGGHKSVNGVVLSNGHVIKAQKVIITTGTFLGGVIHIGDRRIVSGRMGDSASVGLARTLAQIGFPLARLKTGTPPRLDGRTILKKNLGVQPGDVPPQPFSFINETVVNADKQVSCYMTKTTLESHRIIQDNMAKYPDPKEDNNFFYHARYPKLESGGGKGLGPRYCPSIETKVARFPDRFHQIWLEPEGIKINLPKFTFNY
jgi:tRNA uridine 5-carboxymethylaminomethyl modification enzyme